MVRPASSACIVAACATFATALASAASAQSLAPLCAREPTDALCSFLPQDIVASFGAGYSQLEAQQQRPFDEFSWQSFVALNWPARRDGTPRRASIRRCGAAPRVWESFPTPSGVFGLDGENGRDAIPRECARLARGQRLPVFRLMAKNDHVPVETTDFLEATGQPLIDRNLNFVAFDVRLNDEEATYITSNGLDTVDGQRAFAARGEPVSFPLGYYDDPTTRSGGAVGAIEIKTAWRILDRRRGDRPARFFVRRGLIFVRAENSASGRAFCVRAKLGLVGFHIVHRTRNPTRFSQDWIWSTFEHVDNAPEAANPADPTSNTPVPTSCAPPAAAPGRFSFFDPACVGCVPNAPPVLRAGETEFLWARSPPHAARYATAGRFGTQVVRCWSIFPETDEVNRAFQQALQGTPWANYRLVNSQWQGGIEDPIVENGNIPRFLSNSTLETYVQGGASCLVCHSAAQTAVPGQDANFSFLLRLAALRPLAPATPRSAFGPSCHAAPTSPMVK